MNPKPEFYKVEKNVKIPDCTGGGRPSPMKEAMLKMQLGDSCLMPEGRMNNAWQMAKKLGIKICTRKVTKETRRVWRIK